MEAAACVGSAQTGVLRTNLSTVNALDPFQLAAGDHRTASYEVGMDERSADLAGFAVEDRTAELG